MTASQSSSFSQPNPTTFIESYVSEYQAQIETTRSIKEDLITIHNHLFTAHKKKHNLYLIANGGSAAIMSHVNVDLSKNTDIRPRVFHDPAMMTCFSNDYGYENAYKEALDRYIQSGDIVIAISSSGTSKNIIHACTHAKTMPLTALITLTGFNKHNPVSQLGDVNLWVDSHQYNHVENTHQFWLLLIVDMLIKSIDS